MISGALRLARLHPLLTSAAAFAVWRVTDLVVYLAVARSRGTAVTNVIFSWDSAWYLKAAQQGWPSGIPTDENGQLAQTTWPFPMMLPLIGRTAARLLDESASASAIVTVNLVGGAIAAMLLCLTLIPPLGAGRAIGASVAWSALPATPVFLMGYTEGLFAALTFGSLWALTRHRYLLAGVLLVPAGLTKATVAPFAVTLIITIVVELVRGRVPRSWWRAAVAVTLAIVGVVVWPAWTAYRLGYWDAYAVAHSAWGRSSVPLHDTLQWLNTAVHSPPPYVVIGILLVAAYLAAAVTIVRDSRYPLAFRTLSAVFPAFLLFVGAEVSTARQLLPNPALAAALTSWARRIAVFVSILVVLIGLRAGWIVMFIGPDPTTPAP